MVALMNVAITPTRASRQESVANAPTAYVDFSLPEAHEAGRSVLYVQNGAVACRAATAEEAEVFQHDPGVALHLISPSNSYSVMGKAQGLKIVLRATAQLEKFPEAKAAFVKSAAIWEEKIQTPITIAIDVDFGPTYFGHTWPRFSLGNSNAQELVKTNIYETVRARLIAAATDEQQLAIYNSLPAGSLPTDIGNTTTMTGPSANARALGLLDPIADPDGTEKSLGSPPEVAFNSNYQFDFDSDDGVDPDKIDFEAVAVHEIGHVLGFISRTGARELDSKAPIAPTVWDLFRLRPSTPQDQFSTASRVLSSGGEQLFTAAGVELPLSTGRPDGSGGDGYQGSHWKNDDLINHWYIGVMEVGLPTGKRQVMTAHDLLAIKMMGYELKTGIEMAPEIGGLSGKMQGDALTINGLAVNVENDTIDAQVKVLDDSGNVLAQYPLVQFDPVGASIAGFALQFPGINQWRAATQASLTLLDRFGNHSSTLTTDILGGDSGGPRLSSLSFDGSVLRLKGKRLNQPLSLEINGEVVAISNLTAKGAGKKAQVAATAADLRLSSGANRVRVIGNGLGSNAMVLNL
jgi:Matrixin.